MRQPDLACSKSIPQTGHDLIVLQAGLVMFACPSCLVVFIIPMFFAYPRINLRVRFIPITLNLLTLIAGYALFGYEEANPDVAFHLHTDDFMAVVELFKDGDYLTGYVELPDEYQYLSENGHIYVTSEGDTPTSIYFVDGYDSFDNGPSWGYFYGYEEKLPSSALGCFSWRKLDPPVENWYYCTSHGMKGFWGPIQKINENPP